MRLQSSMTAKELQRLRLNTMTPTGRPLSQREAARLLGIGLNTYARWERGEIPINVTAAKLARLVLQGEVDIGDE